MNAGCGAGAAQTFTLYDDRVGPGLRWSGRPVQAGKDVPTILGVLVRDVSALFERRAGDYEFCLRLWGERFDDQFGGVTYRGRLLTNDERRSASKTKCGRQRSKVKTSPHDYCSI